MTNPMGRVASVLFLCVGVCGLLFCGGCKDDQKTTTQSGSESKGGPPPPTFAAAPVEGFEIGNIAPEIEGEDVDGEVFRLSEYRGKVVVLDFWGDW